MLFCRCFGYIDIFRLIVLCHINSHTLQLHCAGMCNFTVNAQQGIQLSILFASSSEVLRVFTFILVVTAGPGLTELRFPLSFHRRQKTLRNLYDQCNLA